MGTFVTVRGIYNVENYLKLPKIKICTYVRMSKQYKMYMAELDKIKKLPICTATSVDGNLPLVPMALLFQADQPDLAVQSGLHLPVGN